MYPDVQQKAQAELDAVVGPDRLPELSDSSSLPYLNALIKELLRWHPALILGLPHSTLADDEYNGHFIPAKTIVIANVWWVVHRRSYKCIALIDCAYRPRGMTRNPECYPDPEAFIPERFLDENGKLDLSACDPANIVFGFGRRYELPCSCRPRCTHVACQEYVPGAVSPRPRSSCCARLSCTRSGSRALWMSMASLSRCNTAWTQPPWFR